MAPSPATVQGDNPPQQDSVAPSPGVDGLGFSNTTNSDDMVAQDNAAGTYVTAENNTNTSSRSSSPTLDAATATDWQVQNTSDVAVSGADAAAVPLPLDQPQNASEIPEVTASPQPDEQLTTTVGLTAMGNGSSAEDPPASTQGFIVISGNASAANATFRTVLDDDGMRLISVSIPRSLNFGSILSGLGVSAAASLGSVISVSAATVIYVPYIQGAGLIDDFGAQTSPRMRMISVLGVPALGIPATNYAVTVTDSNNVVMSPVILQWSNTVTPVRFLSLSSIMLSIKTSTGPVWTADGLLVDLPVNVQLNLTNSSAPGRLPVTISATNVNLLSVALAMWPTAPSVVTNPLQSVTFSNLTSQAPAGIMYITARSANATFRAALDTQGLRLMVVSMPNTLSFGSILTGLGATGASSLPGNNVIIASSSSILYVPSVNGSGVVDEFGAQQAPGLRVASTLAIPALSVSASNMNVTVAGSNGTILPTVTIQFPTARVSTVRFLNISGVLLSISQSSAIWSATGRLVDVPVNVALNITNTTTANQLPVSISATNVNLFNATRTMWSSAPAVVTNLLQTTTFSNLTSQMIGGIMYITARSADSTFRAALDSQGLRLMVVSMPNTLSFGSILTGLGVTGASSLGSSVNASSSSVVYVPAVNGSGVVDEFGVQQAPGLRLASTVAVPGLNIPASNVTVTVAGADGTVLSNITLQWSTTVSPMRFLILTGVILTITPSTGAIWSATGRLVDVPVNVALNITNTTTANQLPVSISATNVNLLNASRTMWPNVASAVTNTLQSTIYSNLSSQVSSGIMFITARSANSTFRAALDTQGLRLMVVSMPNTLSFGSILTGLGVTGASSLGSSVNASSSSVVYVPAVNGSGVVDEFGVQQAPGLRLASTVAVPGLNIPASNVTVTVAGADGIVLQNITLQWPVTVSPVRFLNLTGVTLTISTSTGSTWSSRGQLVDVQVTVQLSVANTTTASQTPVSISATNVNLTNATVAMWPSAPAVVISTLQSTTFSTLNSSTQAGIMFITARSANSTFRAALDSQGLRLMVVSMPNTLSFGSILTGLGVTGASSLPGTIVNSSSSSVTYVPSGSGVVDEFGAQQVPGLRLASTVAVPGLNIPASNVTVTVADGSGVVLSNIAVQAFVASGQLVNVPVNMRINITNATTPNPLPVTISAANVNMLTAARTMWPNVSSVITTTLQPITYSTLTSQRLASGIMYITARSADSTSL
eukprot:gene9551-9715_t